MPGGEPAFSAGIDAMLAEFHVLSLAVCSAGELWAAPLFYVFDPPGARLLFATDPATRHGILLERSPTATATVSDQDRAVATLHGLQMRGRARRLDEPDGGPATALYCNTFPVPEHLTLVLWEYLPEYVKATDNRVRFGYKEKWPGG